MRRNLIFLLALAFTLAACKHEFTTISQPGKTYHYDVTLKNATVSVNWSISRELIEISKNPEVHSVTTTTNINGHSATVVENDTIRNVMSVPVEEAFAMHLAKLGPDYEILEGSKYLTYPLVLKENMELPSESIRVKANLNGKEVIGEIAVKDRTFGPVETITTPAGTFECLRSHEIHTMSFEGLENVLETTLWYGRGIGFVKQHTDATNGTVDIELNKID